VAGGRLPRSIRKLVAGRQFEFAVERATFRTVLHRLFVSGSDRAAEKWRADYRIEGTVRLRLQHLYRTMAWLGEPLADQTGASELAPRCRKDLVEEELFARRRDLFAELSIVFMDTTSLSFEGQGGEELGRRGHSKDHRPDLHQMIVGLVMDQDGRPLCSELWPGNTADVATLLPVVDRLRARFGVGRICVVADRGMISAATIAALEERKLKYVLGVRERSRASVIVDANQAWDETTALRCLPILAELGVRLVEQPLPAWNLAGMARLRARSTVPLMADERVFSAHDMLDVARAGATDVVSLKLVKHGGLLATREVAGVAEAAGIGLYGGCLLESSIGAAAHLQVLAGLRELGWGCEHFGPQILVDDLVEEPLRFADFRVHLPAGPGLGVALDRNKLLHYARG
jgi:hypothetical protein